MVDEETEQRAAANRKRLLEATAATLLLLRRRRGAIVSAGIRRGASPERIATSLKDSLRIGLLSARDAARAGGLMRLERELAAAGRATGLTRPSPAQIVRDVHRAVAHSTSYARQWLNAATASSLVEASAKTDHALVRTATTEAVDAFNAGRADALDALGAPELGRRWDAKLDARVCDFCFGLDGTIVAAGQAFPDGDPPVHPNCRCTWSLVELNSGVTLWRLPRGRSVNERPHQRPVLQ
jgi:SPP1 gp7 family putative phage head morphogenesis protein